MHAHIHAYLHRRVGAKVYRCKHRNKKIYAQVKTHADILCSMYVEPTPNKFIVAYEQILKSSLQLVLRAAGCDNMIKERLERL